VVWRGGFYVRNPEQGVWRLRLELQSHEPTSAVFLNGRLLGYLPTKDWAYSWVSASLPVPANFLRQGYNELTILAGRAAPLSQGSASIWDEVLFRGILLERRIGGR